MSNEIILQIDLGIAIVLVLAVIQYVWLPILHNKPKRERFESYEQKSIIERGHEQFQNLVSKHLNPPIIMYK